MFPLTVVVLGAGKGIGESIAKAYAEAQASRILITAPTAADASRVTTDLEAIHETVSVLALATDATDPASYANIATY